MFLLYKLLEFRLWKPEDLSRLACDKRPCRLSKHLKRFGRPESYLGKNHEEAHMQFEKIARAFAQNHNIGVNANPSPITIEFQVSGQTVRM
jgi:hypothetical protein